MKKILMISNIPLGRSGLPTVVLSIVKNLHSSYLFDALLFTDRIGEFEEEFLSYGGAVFHRHRTVGTNPVLNKLQSFVSGPLIYKHVRNILESSGPYATVHCHNGYESAPALKAASDCGVPVRIAHTHVITEPGSVLRQLLNNYRRNVIEHLATHKIGCSDDACCAFFRNPETSLTVFNTYDENRFDPQHYPERHFPAPRLLQIASFQDLKNQLFSVQVLQGIRQVYPEAKLVFIGFPIGNYMDLVKQAVSENGLEESVEFLPRNADSPLLLSQSDAFLLPSKREGLGIVLIEAQAMGVRCYTSTNIPASVDCGGVRFLSLDAGAQEWARVILEDYLIYHGAHQHYDTEIFRTSHIMHLYEKIYGGDNP